MDRLPKELDGLSIAHLSDLHFTGRIGIEFFEEVVRQTTALRADMIVITGDVLDEIEYLDWFDRTLAKLSAPLGIYFVLGNHDQFTGEAPRLRRALETDRHDRSGRPLEAIGSKRRGNHSGRQRTAVVHAAGQYAALPGPIGRQRRSCGFCLSHSPDQFAWARRWDFDLMLAGHTHGGQICLPIVGPIVCPSWHGVQICQRHVLR